MKIALIGYGKMGKEIEQILIARGHTIPLIIDLNNTNDLDAAHLQKVDVAIEFTTPSTAYGNVVKCLEAGVPVVCGTTAWLDNLPQDLVCGHFLREVSINFNKEARRGDTVTLLHTEADGSHIVEGRCGEHQMFIEKLSFDPEPLA